MKPYLIPIFILTISCNYCNAQQRDTIFHDAGFYNTIQWSSEEPTLFIPQVWVYLKKFYIEVRYNYEDQKTASLYFGRSFSFDKKANWEITPMIGVVLGRTNGLSPGFNFEFEYKRFSTFTQCQYTIDFKNIKSSFFWDWTGFNINISNHFGLGGSVQFYSPTVGERFNRIGPMISYHHKIFTIELYAYNFWRQYPSGAVGIEYQFK